MTQKKIGGFRHLVELSSINEESPLLHKLIKHQKNDVLLLTIGFVAPHRWLGVCGDFSPVTYTPLGGTTHNTCGSRSRLCCMHLGVPTVFSLSLRVDIWTMVNLGAPSRGIGLRPGFVPILGSVPGALRVMK